MEEAQGRKKVNPFFSVGSHKCRHSLGEGGGEEHENERGKGLHEKERENISISQ